MLQIEQKYNLSKYYPIQQSGKLEHMKSTTPGNDSISNTLLKARSLYS